jgi:hypothetical protein
VCRPLDEEKDDEAIKDERGGKWVRLWEVGNDDDGADAGERPTAGEPGWLGLVDIAGDQTMDEIDMDDDRAGCIEE